MIDFQKLSVFWPILYT